MWIVVSMTGSKAAADRIRQLLEAEGVFVKLREASSRIKSTTFEVLVLESEVDLAREVLIENGL